MASQSQNATNVSSAVSPANGSSGSSTTISVCTTKMQSLASTPPSQPYQQQHSSPSSSPSPSPSPMQQPQQQQQHLQTLQQPNNVEALDKNSSNTLKVRAYLLEIFFIQEGNNSHPEVYLFCLNHASCLGIIDINQIS